MGTGMVLIITGCSKDTTTAPDTTAPVVTVNGPSSIEVSLNSGTWTDLNATANDYVSGSVTVTSDASATNPNTNLVGTYTITYTATDAAGNKGSAIRNIRVKNDAEGFAKTYNVNDVIPSATLIYTQTITVDATINNKVHFNRFGDYNNNTDIFALRDPVTGKLSIPKQSSGHDIGTNNLGQCDVVTHFFYTTNFQILTSSYVFSYVDSLANNIAACNGTSTTGSAEYSF